MRVNYMNRFLVLMIMMLSLLPLRVFGAEEIRYRYASSLYADDKGVGLNQPEGVACSKDRLVVADTGHGRLVIYPIQAGEPREGREVVLPQVLYPNRLATTSKGDLFVLDGKQRKVIRLSADGDYKQYVDFSGLPTEGMVVPTGICVDSADALYVLDILGRRVLVFGDDGKFQRQIVFPKEYGFISDVAVDPRGTVFLIDSVNALVYSTAKDPTSFTSIGENLKDDMKFALNIAADDKGVLYITDQNGASIVVVQQDGTVRNLLTMGWKEGSLRYPAQLCLDSDGDLFIADRANSRIQKFVPLK
jgi:sugar lactone lactonase YvrE